MFPARAMGQSSLSFATPLARCVDRWQEFDAGQQARARTTLESLHRQAGLSCEVFEVAGKALHLA